MLSSINMNFISRGGAPIKPRIRVGGATPPSPVAAEPKIVTSKNLDIVAKQTTSLFRGGMFAHIQNARKCSSCGGFK